MTVGTIADYLRYGTLSARPASPSITAVSSGSARYYATDTKTDYAWDGSMWQPVGIYDTVVSKSANYSIVAADNNATLIANAAGLVFTLPAPATAGAGFWVIVKNNGQTTTGIKTNAAGVLLDGVDCSSTAFTGGLTTAQGAVKIQTDGTAWYSVAMDSVSGGGGGSTLTTASAYLSANVTMTNANQYYDGPSVSLAPGTWLLIGSVLVIDTTSSGDATAKLWDGTTVISSGMGLSRTGTRGSSIAVSGFVTLGSTTTIKISAADDDANATITAAANVNGAGNNASYLLALKIG